MKLYNMILLFVKEFFFYNIVLFIFLLSPIGRFAPQSFERSPSLFQELTNNFELPDIILQLISGPILIGMRIIPIIAFNFYFWHFNKFRYQKEDYRAIKNVLIIGGSTLISIPYQLNLGFCNFTLPVFLTSLTYIFWGNYRLKNQAQKK